MTLTSVTTRMVSQLTGSAAKAYQARSIATVSGTVPKTTPARRRRIFCPGRANQSTCSRCRKSSQRFMCQMSAASPTNQASPAQ